MPSPLYLAVFVIFLFKIITLGAVSRMQYFLIKMKNQKKKIGKKWHSDSFS